LEFRLQAAKARRFRLKAGFKTVRFANFHFSAYPRVNAFD
jgi:hypothetical protein